jgi:hypothetical protein
MVVNNLQNSNRLDLSQVQVAMLIRDLIYVSDRFKHKAVWMDDVNGKLA